MDFLDLKIAVLSQANYYQVFSSGTLAILPLPPSLQTFFTGMIAPKIKFLT